MSLQKNLIINILLFIAIFLVFASALHAQEHWWQRKDEGWFFYNEPPVPEEAPESEITKNLPPTAPEQAPVESAPVTLFTEKMKKQGEEYMSAAMENPTRENLYRYMVHNHEMMSRSEAFSVAWQKALMAHPELDSSTPTDTNKDLYFKVRAEEERQQLYALSQKAGLFFIFSSSCPYCQRQAVNLKRLQDMYPFLTIKAVSIDGGVLPEFPDALPDNGIALRLGIKTVPDIFLAFPPDRFELIASSILTTEDLKARLLWYIDGDGGSETEAALKQEDQGGNK